MNNFFMVNKSILLNRQKVNYHLWTTSDIGFGSEHQRKYTSRKPGIKVVRQNRNSQTSQTTTPKREHPGSTFKLSRVSKDL